jgi:hypothetical protein
LGSGDFVEEILRRQEALESERSQIKKKGIGFEELAERVKKNTG